jgi:aspartyl-tRNA(Asn)/glutamyl-tRNA(Gln) amidotransferase subunit B
MLNSKDFSISNSPVTAIEFSKLLTLIENNKITTIVAKIVFDEMVKTKKDPEIIVKEKNLEQVSDLSELETMVLEVFSENPGEVVLYRNGKTKLFSFFMGKIMKKTQGKADPKIVTQMLKSKL